MDPIIDPRCGDFEDDASSPKRRSLLSLASVLLVEISLPKLALAWLLMIVLPSLSLGLAPLAVTAWASTIKSKFNHSLVELWYAVLFAAVVALGWFGGRALFRLAKRSFFSLNSLAVEPIYLICREGMRFVAERLLPSRANQVQYATLRAIAAAAAGFTICGLACYAFWLAWPNSRWVGTVADLFSLHLLAPVVAANSIVLVSAYVAVASLVWGISDVSTAQPHTVNTFSSPAKPSRIWRIAHLSDLHAVGERYGFRIESGRAGPRGNERLKQVLARLALVHAQHPLDGILITGDMTDAGRSAEWSEFLDALAPYPQLVERLLVLPGNHDLNIADRTDPARLELPTSPNRRLRQLRSLSVMCTLQGRRVRVVDHATNRVGECLADALEPHLAEMANFADVGRPRLSKILARLWDAAFPMIVPPDTDNGLGIILLNSNVDSQFSFTNALGMIPAEQVRGIEIAAAQYPRAGWVIALHHHPVEYPRAGHALSERIGTALINGNWFIRRLRPLADRAIVMHGHRHVDWIGNCAGVLIVSAPSPVMEVTDDFAANFYIHSLVVEPAGRLGLMVPQRILLNSPAAATDSSGHSMTMRLR